MADLDQLRGDLEWVLGYAEDPAWLTRNADLVEETLRDCIESGSLYLKAADAITHLLATGLAHPELKPLFARIAATVNNHSPGQGKQYEIAFRDAIGACDPLIGLYAELSTLPAERAEALLDAYTQLFKAQSFTDGVPLDEALLDQAMAVAQKVSRQISVARLHQTLALCYTHTDSYLLAERHGKIAFNYFSNAYDPVGLADAACTLAIIYRIQAKYAQADHYMSIAVDEAKEEGDEKQFAVLLYEQGVRCYRLNEYEMALAFLQTVMPIFQEHNAPYQIAMTEEVIGMVYIYMHKFELAETYLQSAVQTWQALGNHYELVNLELIRGQLEFERGNRDRALSQLEQTEERAYSSLEDTPARDDLIERIEQYIEKNHLRLPAY